MDKRRLVKATGGLLIIALVIALITTLNYQKVQAVAWAESEEGYQERIEHLEAEARGLIEQAVGLEQTVLELEEKMGKLSVLSDLIDPLGREAMLQFIEEYPSSSPFDSTIKITSRFGEGTGFGHRLNHGGTDMVPRGSWMIHPMWEGVVSEIGIDQELGKFITVMHGERVRTTYAHLDTIYYTALPGEEVDEGVNMGIMGNTGRSTAAHLHLVLEIYDGEKWVAVDIYPFLRREV